MFLRLQPNLLEVWEIFLRVLIHLYNPDIMKLSCRNTQEDKLRTHHRVDSGFRCFLSFIFQQSRFNYIFRPLSNLCGFLRFFPSSFWHIKQCKFCYTNIFLCFIKPQQKGLQFTLIFTYSNAMGTYVISFPACT